MNLICVIRIGVIFILWDLISHSSGSSVPDEPTTEEIKRYDPVSDFGIDFKQIPLIVRKAKQFMGPDTGKPKRVKFLGPIVAQPSQKYYKRQIRDYVQHSLLPLRPVPKYRMPYPRYRNRYYRLPPRKYRYSRIPYQDEVGYVDDPYYGMEDENPYLMPYRTEYEPGVSLNEIEQMIYGDEKPVDYRMPYYPDVYADYNNYRKEKAEALKLHEALVSANYFRKSSPYPDSDTAYSESYYSTFPSK